MILVMGLFMQIDWFAVAGAEVRVIVASGFTVIVPEAET
jgi:hypothetical protein